MINSECLRSLEKMDYDCAVNLRYHQIMQSRWGRLDQVVRFAVAFFAVLDLICFMRKDEYWGWFAVLGALLLALLLNIVPFGERGLFYGRIFKGWSDIKRDCDSLIIKLRAHVADADTTPDCHERLRELSDRRHAVESEEPAPFKGLLSDCQDDENRSRTGLLTKPEIDQERQRRLSIIARANLGAAAGARAESAAADQA